MKILHRRSGQRDEGELKRENTSLESGVTINNNNDGGNRDIDVVKALSDALVYPGRL